MSENRKQVRKVGENKNSRWTGFSKIGKIERNRKILKHNELTEKLPKKIWKKKEHINWGNKFEGTRKKISERYRIEKQNKVRRKNLQKLKVNQ